MDKYELTWRERLADWISGGKISQQITKQSATNRRFSQDVFKLRNALLQIHAETVCGRSGTAQKIARMAKDALK